METATAVDVRRWIYQLTKDISVGRDGVKDSYGKSNGNYITTLSDSVAISLGGEPGGNVVELPGGSEVVVYANIKPTKDGIWTPQSDRSLATIFLKDGAKTIGQIVVRMNGRVTARMF